MTLLDDAKKAARIMSNFYDDEINDLLGAGKAELQLAGIFFEDKDALHPLIKRALITYVKGHFGYDNPEAPRFLEAYLHIKQHLQLSGEFNEPLE